MNAVVPGARPQYLRFMHTHLDDGTATRLLGVIEGARGQGATEIHLALNILGGITQTAVAVYNSLVHSATPIFLYNIGSVASAGTTAFVGGHTRYVSQFATFLIHPHASNYNGHLSMAHAADIVAHNAASEAQVEAILRARTQIPDGALNDRKIRDVHIDAPLAVRYGIASEIREFTAPAGAPIIQIL